MNLLRPNIRPVPAASALLIPYVPNMLEHKLCSGIKPCKQKTERLLTLYFELPDIAVPLEDLLCKIEIVL